MGFPQASRSSLFKQNVNSALSYMTTRISRICPSCAQTNVRMKGVLDSFWLCHQATGLTSACPLLTWMWLPSHKDIWTLGSNLPCGSLFKFCPFDKVFSLCGVQYLQLWGKSPTSLYSLTVSFFLPALKNNESASHLFYIGVSSKDVRWIILFHKQLYLINKWRNWKDNSLSKTRTHTHVCVWHCNVYYLKISIVSDTYAYVCTCVLSHLAIQALDAYGKSDSICDGWKSLVLIKHSLDTSVLKRKL